MVATIGDALRASGRIKLRAARSLDLAVAEAADAVAGCLRDGGQVYVAGNGGSAADAQHFAAEFTGKFRTDRAPLPVLSLTTDTSALTAIGNDYGFDDVFARPMGAFAREGDVFIALSTSGSSANVVRAADVARARGVTVVAMTGAAGGELARRADVHVRVPSGNTAWIQECTMSALHALCDEVEQRLGMAGPQPARIGAHPGLAELVAAREEWRRQGVRLVTTNGCFDVLHAGHLASLELAARLGDVLVVLVNSDDSVRALKGPARPVNPQAARTALLAALEPVDHVLVFDDADPVAVLGALAPDVHCKGEEYADGARPMPERDVVERHGGEVRFLPRVPGLSSTSLIELTGSIALEADRVHD